MTHYLLLALICVAATPAWNEVQFGEKTILAVCHDLLHFFARVPVILLRSSDESHLQIMATKTRFQRSLPIPIQPPVWNNGGRLRFVHGSDGCQLFPWLGA
jgi:hypothetical protein